MQRNFIALAHQPPIVHLGDTAKEAIICMDTATMGS